MDKQERKLLITFFLLLYFIIMLRNAWICDDAYISFRVIDNFVNGFGLRWNVVERVQAFTHPLWVFLLSPFYALIGDMYLTALFISLILSIGAVSIYGFKLANSTTSACLGILILSLSDSFIDYSTSGLENPLTFFIIAIFLYIYFKKPDDLKKLFYLSLWASLGAVNRLDTILIYLPILAFSFWKIRSFRSVKILLVGFIPLIAWELFSLIYYGFPFPNTAYAKLSTGLENSYLIPQGLAYLHTSLIFDPLTILILILGIVIPLVIGKHRLLPLAAAIVLYLLYVIKIGGCFMYGRHLSAPLFVAVIVLGCWPISSRKIVIGLAGIILLLGISPPRSPLFYKSTEDNKDIWSGKGICDERAFYNAACGFGNYNFDPGNWPTFSTAQKGRQFKINQDSFLVTGMIGMQGFFAGPRLFILDHYALTDPLLARLPVISKIDMRIGHFKRKLPGGYAQTALTGNNTIFDKNLAEYYDKLNIITKSPIFSVQRFSEIVKFNLGYYNNLLKSYSQAHLISFDLAKVNKPTIEGTNWMADHLFRIEEYGLEVTLPEIFHYDNLEFARDHNDDYLATFYLDDEEIGSTKIPRNITPMGGITISRINIKPEVYTGGFNKIRFVPTAGDGLYVIGHVLFPDRAPDSTMNQPPDN